MYKEPYLQGSIYIMITLAGQGGSKKTRQVMTSTCDLAASGLADHVQAVEVQHPRHVVQFRGCRGVGLLTKPVNGPCHSDDDKNGVAAGLQIALSGKGAVQVALCHD